MRILGVVVALVVGSATATVQADPIKIGGIQVVLPCAVTPTVKPNGALFECQGARLAVEVGVVSAKEYLAKILAKIPDNQKQIADVPLGSTTAWTAEWTIPSGVMFAVVFDRAGNREGVAFLGGGKAADAASVRKLLQTLAIESMKATIGTATASAPTAPAAPTPTPVVKSGKLAFTTPFVQAMGCSSRAIVSAT